VSHAMSGNADTIYLIIKDCKARVLGDEVWKASDDYGLFHFTPTRKILDRSIFADCAFFDLFINHKTQWGAPIPSTFQAFFKDLLKLMIPEGETLFFNVVDLYEGYFEENKFIDEFLKPHGYLYFFLNKEINGQICPRLFFECPIDQVNILDDVAFAGTVIDVDGFVHDKSKVALYEKWSREGNTDVMFRDLIRNVYMAFGVWGDHNGIFVVTDKFDIPTLEKRLRGTPLEQEIEKYIYRFTTKSA
jgi:hypothetical protein